MLATSVKREDITKAKADAEKWHFFTGLEFLRAHFGIRRGCYSLLMGTPGSGKSSLAKLIAIQAATSKQLEDRGEKVLIWLSEELKEKYSVNMQAYADKIGFNLESILFIEESSIDPSLIKSHDDFLNLFREAVVANNAGLVVIDNVTTGRFYGPQTSVPEQGKSTQFLKTLPQDLDIALLPVIHTSTKVSDNMGRLFTTEDVRGLKSIALEASYFYALQKFTRNGETFSFVRNLKYREHDKADITSLLSYDKDLSIYTGDTKVDFSKVKEIFQSADRLK